ncbi:MAG: hypothetical protein PHH83_01615 [Patescibacteria group bacterium]|nr:hypothetical protein [Patescibacteria group bacterium]
MSYKYFSKYLSNNEELLNIFHYSIFFLVIKILLRFILFLGAFFFMFPIMKLGIMGFVLFFIIIFFCIISTYIVYKKWEYDCLVVTNKKCINCYFGFLKNDMEEFLLDNILQIDIEYRNLFFKLFKIGDLLIKLKNREIVYFDFIYKPLNVKNFILETRV